MDPVADEDDHFSLSAFAFGSVIVRQLLLVSGAT